MARYENGLAIIGGPRLKNAVGFGIGWDAKIVETIREQLRIADAENKIEVFVQIGEKCAAFTFEAFEALIFPAEEELKEEAPVAETIETPAVVVVNLP